MLERKPPRRDPRILALLPSSDAVEYAALDAWEIAGTGAIPTDDPRGFALSVRRLIVQTRPTVLVCAPPRVRKPKLARLLKLAATAATHSGIPLVSLAGDLARELLDEAPATDAIAAQYPELRALGTDTGVDAVRLASAALSSLTFPSRSYDTSTTPRSRATMAPGAPYDARGARVPCRPPDRGADEPSHRGGGARPRPPRP